VFQQTTRIGQNPTLVERLPSWLLVSNRYLRIRSPLVTQAIQKFLGIRQADHNGPDLIARWTPDMETQVNVSSRGGIPVEGMRNTYENDQFRWWNIRVPKKANSIPEWNDYELTWPLDLYAEAIGSTGWDWRNCCSRWVGFDFDAIVGHAAGVGIDDDRLREVAERAQQLPYVEVRKSTGGSGIHIYVLLDAIPTGNHTEHAALGRCALSLMSSAVGFDFAANVDACGGNMWIWHTKSNPENEGLKLIKAAECVLTEADLPGNWRDHIDVVTKKRGKIRLTGVIDGELDEFDELTASRESVPLDDIHKSCIAEAGRLGYTSVWVSDHQLWQTHTKALEEIRRDGNVKIKGVFETNSEGSDKGTPNCFCFPAENGEFKVYRFGKGIVESELWNQDGANWTWCHFNAIPDFLSAAIAAGGSPVADSDGFAFANASEARPAVEMLGGRMLVPDQLAHRPVTLRPDDRGRIVAIVRKDKANDPSHFKGWENTKPSEWRHVISVNIAPKRESKRESYDRIVRSAVNVDGDGSRWFATTIDGNWVRQPMETMKAVLAALGHIGAFAAGILGTAALNPWQLVNLPFQPAYPGGRQWNKDGAQLRFQPAELADGETPYHPHWDLILDHIGQDLTAAVRKHAWCQSADVVTGADYLCHWIASMIRFPFGHLPYLFLYGPQNSGKSILHEAISLLLTKGVVVADRALTNSNDFNGELANAVLCIVEEKDISKAQGAYNKIKEWATAQSLSIRKMRTDSYSQPNTTHWIQCANRSEFCPVFPGDSRITVIHVPLPSAEIPKDRLLEELVKEAPHFMRTLMDVELAEPMGRLRIPVIVTEDKQRLQELNRTPAEAFLAEVTVQIPGAKVLFSELKEKLREWLDLNFPNAKVTDEELKAAMPHGVYVRPGTGNQRYVENLTFVAVPASMPDALQVIQNHALAT